MKKFFLFVMMFAGIELLASQINWVENYSKALQIAQKENKPIIFVMKKHGCRYCKKLENETFKDVKVINKINKNFVPVKLYADEPTSCMPYTLAVYTNGFPTIWFLRKNGEILTGMDPKTMQPYAFKIPGFVNAQAMSEILDDALSTNKIK